MTKKEVVQIASRAISLYLIFVSLGNLVEIPPLLYAVSHYAAQPVSVAQDYAHQFYLVNFVCRLALSIGLLIAAVWTYRCGPQIQAFLSPSEKQ